MGHLEILTPHRPNRDSLLVFHIFDCKVGYQKESQEIKAKKSSLVLAASRKLEGSSRRVQTETNR